MTSSLPAGKTASIIMSTNTAYMPRSPTNWVIEEATDASTRLQSSGRDLKQA
jgi:hypothetical protein